MRCVARYLRDAGEVEGDSLALEIRGVAYELQFMNDGSVRVDMGRPSFAPKDIPIAADNQQDCYEVAFDGQVCAFGCVSIGNPHATILVDDVAAAPVLSIGSALQRHRFFPDRVNVGYMQVIDRGRVKLRVYERGVGETLACGTGACAAVAIGVLWDRLDHVVDVELAGGTLADRMGRERKRFIVDDRTRRVSVRRYNRSMNGQSDDEITAVQPLADGEMVAQYLRANPNYFEQFPDVLRDLDITHGAGGAVSLLERQVTTLRDDNTRMQARFEQLVALATSNEDLIKRIHNLALALMESAGPEAIFATLSEQLVREFNADRVRTIVIANPAFVDSNLVPEFVGTQWSDRNLFSEIWRTKAPKCGGLTDVQAISVFPNDAQLVKSAAVLPLSGKGWDGLLVISSDDAARFNEDMGTEFLAYLGDIVSLIVDPWVARD